MTFRLTCLLIFTLLLASPLLVSGESSTTNAPLPTPVAVDTSTIAQAIPGPTETFPYKCPSDKSYTNEDCSNGCGPGEQCFRDMKKSPKETIKACCGSLDEFCPSTKLHSWHSGGQGFLYSMSGIKPEELYKWYERKFTKASPQNVACPQPYSFSLVSNVLPVNWANILPDAENNVPNTLKPCSINKECQEGEFCDAVNNPTFNISNFGLDKSDNGKSLRFCYPLPTLDPKDMYDGQTMKHVQPTTGLKICTLDRECGAPDQICHHTGQLYRNESNPSKVDIPGICVEVTACVQPNDAKREGVLNKNSQKCQNDDACADSGVLQGNANYNPKCRSYWRADASRKVCCFENNPKCRKGDADTPLKKCTQMTDCTGEVPKNKWNKWCDDGGLNVCCKDLKNELWQCPDLATPLFNEPKCKGYIEGKENSGTCPQAGARCRHGHCCPGTHVTNKGTKIVLGRKLYRTQFPCDPNTAVPSDFIYAFCNPEDKKLVVTGTFHDNGDKMTKVSGKKCTINADCSSDGSSVCIYENAMTHVCYFNPLRALRPEVSSIWKTVLIISLIFGGIFLVLALISFVCYRSKSVFDKYKKKGKGKKGSGSKSSKDSKKGGKKGKKGGKKGKKGDKDSASSKSKKTKSKKETEKSKSEATTGDGSTSSQIN